ncbi:hypothetical protein KW783_03540, partial [Candidatus Parcubacteria bacterium]|nr:hypothetical protein [Candidatus Parcubacteria bacterium]
MPLFCEGSHSIPQWFVGNEEARLICPVLSSPEVRRIAFQGDVTLVTLAAVPNTGLRRWELKWFDQNHISDYFDIPKQPKGQLL